MMPSETPRLSSSVLVADDDAEVRALIAETLRRDGHRVAEARDGLDLLDRLREVLDDPSRRAVVVVTDVLMPNLSGLGVLAAIHRSRWQIPVILMTALHDDSVLTLAQRFGALSVFKKPVNVDDLRTAVLSAQLTCAFAGRGADTEEGRVPPSRSKRSGRI